ncbi:unnamed protein product, partial [Iphiclides podalirius]
MTGSSSGGPESKDEKRLNDDLVVFMRKRSETDAPRYTERLKTYVNLQQKRRRAAAARRNAGYEPHDKISNKKKADNEQKDKVPISGRVIGDKSGVQSRPRSGEQSDACRRARRRRSCGRVSSFCFRCVAVDAAAAGVAGAAAGAAAVDVARALAAAAAVAAAAATVGAAVAARAHTRTTYEIATPDTAYDETGKEKRKHHPHIAHEGAMPGTAYEEIGREKRKHHTRTAYEGATTVPAYEEIGRAKRKHQPRMTYESATFDTAYEEVKRQKQIGLRHLCASELYQSTTSYSTLLDTSLLYLLCHAT